MASRRVALISGHAGNPLTPRGERTRELARALSAGWDVEVIGPSVVRGGGGPVRGRLMRRVAGEVARSALLDRWELWSFRRFNRWRPQVDAALLVGYPFSPLVNAARSLSRAGVPYVVDAGDPWALTALRPHPRLLALQRARRAERELLSNAAGAVLTTGTQASALRRLFPALPMLVRPNGYYPPSARPTATPDRTHDDRLRLGHFGMLSTARRDPVPFLTALVESGLWRGIAVAQIGRDFTGMLDRLPPSVLVERHAARPWAEVLAAARDHDAAVVLGNRNKAQLPSKAVQYLTLPIPRIALTERGPDDELDGYVRGRPGWLVVSGSEVDVAQRVQAHVARRWTEAELAPPPEEGWPSVARQVVDFMERCVGSAVGVPRGFGFGQAVAGRT